MPFAVLKNGRLKFATNEPVVAILGAVLGTTVTPPEEEFDRVWDALNRTGFRDDIGNVWTLKHEKNLTPEELPLPVSDELFVVVAEAHRDVATGPIESVEVFRNEEGVDAFIREDVAPFLKECADTGEDYVVSRFEHVVVVTDGNGAVVTYHIFRKEPK